MIMSAPTGSAASNWTDEAQPEIPPQDRSASGWPRWNYLHDLALRREALAIRRQIVYGLAIGWVLLLACGFIYFCVPSRVDLLWSALMVLGALHLAAAVILPQALYWPERVWSKIARWQGWIIMTVLLTLVYFALIWPAGYFSRRRAHGFVVWEQHPTNLKSAWEPIDLSESEVGSTAASTYRSLPLLLASVVGFFFRRGDYLVVVIVVLLVVLGLVLYFVQSSALAPFIYTLF
jgi:Family of unknown function (DUF5989)